MKTMTISLTDEQLEKLKEKAKTYGITPEELVKIEIDELLSVPDKKFKKALDYVMNKNQELYKRLAK